MIWNCDYVCSLQTRKRARDRFHGETEIVSYVLAIHRDVDVFARAQAVRKEQEKRSDTFFGCLPPHDRQVVLDVVDALRQYLKQSVAQVRIVPAMTFDPLLRKRQQREIDHGLRREPVISYRDEAEIVSRKQKLRDLSATIGQMFAEADDTADETGN